MPRAQKGQRVPGSGRKKGTPNKKTVELMQLLDGKNFSPGEELVYCYQQFKKIYLIRARNRNLVGAVIALEKAANVASDIAQYVYPKKKAIEHSGEVGVKTFADFVAAGLEDDEDEDEGED